MYNLPTALLICILHTNKLEQILVGFVGQAALSLGLSAWVFFLTTHGNIDITHPEGTPKREIEHKRLDFVSNILMIGSDIQTTLGIAYMVTVFSQAMIMDTYHLHVVFDIVSFVGVSNTAALVCWRFCRAKLEGSDTSMNSHPKSKRESARKFYWNDRSRAAFLFTALYIALTILLCVRLHEWAPDTAPGRCYYTHLVTSVTASHPGADETYVGTTASWLVVVLLFSIFGGVRLRRGILILSYLQFPLHLYMTLALRIANEGKFEGEMKHENEWDFGQTTAVVLLGIAVVEFLKKGKEYYDFETYVVKHGTVPGSGDHDQSQSRDEEANADSYLLKRGSADGESPTSNA